MQTMVAGVRSRLISIIDQRRIQMEQDTRVWMYRDGESHCFDNAKSVPKNEGWVDSPAKVEPAQTGPSLDELKAQAEELGIEVHPRHKEATLSVLIAEAKAKAAEEANAQANG